MSLSHEFYSVTTREPSSIGDKKRFVSTIFRAVARELRRAIRWSRQRRHDRLSAPYVAGRWCDSAERELLDRLSR